MKTTIDIPDSLLREARKLAIRERTTLRALVEQGLQRIVADRKRKPAFRLRKASFKGRGLRPELADAGWDQLRELIYEGRGGDDRGRH
jgi:Bacterial antitoxin of type II TA system, VapB